MNYQVIAAYVLLSVAWLIGAAWTASNQHTLKESQTHVRVVQRDIIKLVGRGQFYDCLDRRALREAMDNPPPPGAFGDCPAIERTWNDLARESGR